MSRHAEALKKLRWELVDHDNKAQLAALDYAIGLAKSFMEPATLISALKLERAQSDSVRAAMLGALAAYGKEVADEALVAAANAAMPAAHPFHPPAEWQREYEDAFRATGDRDCGVDPDADCDRCCRHYWRYLLNDDERAERLQNPLIGRADGIKDATDLNDA